MELRGFRTGDWLLVAGGAVMLVLAQLLDWATVDSELGSGGLHNAFDYPATGGIAWLLTVTAGLLTFLHAGGLVKPGRAPWPVLMLGATGLATVLMVLRLILGAGEINLPGLSIGLGRGAGMWVAFVAAALALAGAYLNHRDSVAPVRPPTAGSRLLTDDVIEPPPPPPPAV